jgi:hypothetical protein
MGGWCRVFGKDHHGKTVLQLQSETGKKRKKLKPLKKEPSHNGGWFGGECCNEFLSISFRMGGWCREFG